MVLFLIALGGLGAVGGYLFRAKKVYQPQKMTIRNNIAERDRQERAVGSVPKTDPIKYTLMYDNTKVGHTIKKVELDIFIDRDNCRLNEKKVFDVELSQQNIQNGEIIFYGAGNRFKNWKRGDVIIKLQEMGEMEIMKENVLNKIKSCFPNKKNEEYIAMTEIVINGFQTMDEITIPRLDNQGGPIYFVRNEMV